MKPVFRLDIREEMVEVPLDNPLKHLVPRTRIQKLIGERMLKAKQSKPCFYIELKADVTELMGMRPKLKKQEGIKITTNAFYIRALATAVKEYPLMVGRLSGDSIRLADCINVGFAVNAPQGLVVPVLKEADKKTLAEIARLEKLLTEKARSNKLTLEDLEGETIALSNLGSYGVDSFVGIVPPPASTILAVGNVINEVVPKDGKPAVRKMVSLTLAVDRTVADGVYAAQFLNLIKEQLQNPQQLV
ncbi:MAG: 2-oxo acid dehydrogenase subunit E2 [Planctomycetota bacterium]|nr:MAG: 2-oxo acid dehydrogenase subunit E2 [Planctomycetota bacterium]